MRNRLRTGVVVVAVSLGAVAGFGVAVAPLAAAKPAKATKATYPKIKVNDLATGKQFDLSELAKTDTTTLVWFWAPH